MQCRDGVLHTCDDACHLAGGKYTGHCKALNFLAVLHEPVTKLLIFQLLYYMVDKDSVALAHKHEMEELRQFIESKQLTPDLSNRLLKHYEFQHQKAVENLASTSVKLPRSALWGKSLADYCCEYQLMC